MISQDRKKKKSIYYSGGLNCKGFLPGLKSNSWAALNVDFG
jgi:hypothetical protein